MNSAKTDVLYSEAEILKLYHELKLQNEELMRAKEQAELVREKYAALYDFAPSGYFTLSRKGEIMESNLCGSQMLRKARYYLKNTRFDIFVSDDSKPLFNRFLWKVFNNHAKESCEVILSVIGNPPIYAHLNGIVTEDEGLCMITVVDITERKATEMALAESKELYTDLVSYQSAGIYRILVENQQSEKAIVELISMEFVSNRFCELLEIEKASGLKVVNAEVFRKIHPDDLPGFLKSNEVAQQVQQPYFWEGRLLLENGIKWIRFESSPRKLENRSTRWTGVAFDITERKRADEALRNAHRRLESIIEGTHIGTLEWNIQTGETFFNDVWAQIIGYTAVELIPISKSWEINSWEPFSHPDEVKQTAELLNRHFSGELPFYNRECQMKHKNGHWIWVHDRGCVITRTSDNRPLIMSGTRTDITKRKQAEAEIKQKNKELHKINTEKDKYFSIIAHDLRSPFSGFLGLTELMAEGFQRMTLEEIQKIALLMRNSATNLFRLLGNLLEWSRMQRGLTAFVPASFLLKPRISEILVLAQDAAMNKEIDISLAIPEDLVVYADTDMFAGIIRNLLSNAVKFSHKGGSITVSAKTISAKLLEISIMDLGIGMNKKMIANLFLLDTNTNRKGTDGEPTTGLGLIICKDFIEKHGGKLRVESVVGKGSTFRFTLPANQAND